MLGNAKEIRETAINSLVFCLALAALGVVMYRNAWVCDDAYITFRTVDNWVNGFGLTWNVAERVQSYTHPLWMMVFSAIYAITREAYITSIAVGMALTGISCLLLLTLSKSNLVRILSTCTLLVSKAFVDYTTSGLENALSYVLIASLLLIVMRAERRFSLWSVFLSVFVSSLLVLNRMDYALLVAPVLLMMFWCAFQDFKWWRVLLCIIAGGLVFAAWECFSVLYYGIPFPNTAYAKLNTGISAMASCRQGLVYLFDSWQKDTVTQLVICTGVILGVIRGGGARYLALGCVIYFLYVIRIGGDFMSGRFFAIPFLCCVGILMQCHVNRFIQVAFVAVLLGLGIFSTYSPIRTDETYTLLDDWRVTGISDERGAYYQHTGLLRNSKVEQCPDHPWLTEGLKDRIQAAKTGKQWVVKSAVGFYGYGAGPSMHIIDELALTDPLLARLPSRDTETWRIGHFWRDVPEGYVESLRTGENRIADPKVAALYDLLQRVISTNVPIWGHDRLEAIWKLNQ